MSQAIQNLWKDIRLDLAAARQGSPARSLDGFRYALFDSGFRTVALHRLAAALVASTLFRALGLLLWQINTALSSCHIDPKSDLGAGLRLPHATGIVIGRGVRTGVNCTIYQNTTLGRRNASTAESPTLGSSVVLYANAVVIGSCRIGNHVVIGCSSIIATDVEEHSTIKAATVRLA